MNSFCPQHQIHSCKESNSALRLQTMATNTLIESLRSANLLPSNIIPANFTPSVNISVNFPSISPSEGSFVRVSQVKETPTISLSSTISTPSAQSFTFMLIDPDAPTPDDPKFSTHPMSLAQVRRSRSIWPLDQRMRADHIDICSCSSRSPRT
jgi:phosphatidylethanolamine-binding protein (PEBP) family uncharacterized protein